MVLENVMWCDGWWLNMIMMTDDWNDNDNNDDHDDDNHDDDHLIDGDDDQKDGDYPARQTPSARLHGKSRVPTASAAKNKKPIRFARPKKSVPTAERPHRYSLREKPNTVQKISTKPPSYSIFINKQHPSNSICCLLTLLLRKQFLTLEVIRQSKCTSVSSSIQVLVFVSV